VVGVIAAALAGLVPLNVLGELVSMGTLLAFATVCIGVLVLRAQAGVHRPFRVPAVWIICPLGAATCLFLFWQAFVVHWHLFVGWTLLGLLIYLGYGIRNSKLAKSPDRLQAASRRPVRFPRAPPARFDKTTTHVQATVGHQHHMPPLRRQRPEPAPPPRPLGRDRPGIGAVIGGGIFVITGQAAANHAGPAIMLSFVLAAICCLLRAGLPNSPRWCRFPAAPTPTPTPPSASSRLVHRLDAGARIRRLRLGGRGQLDRLFPQPAQPVRHPSTGGAPLDAQLRPTGAIANLPAAALVLLLTWLCYVGISKSSAMNMAMVVLKTGLIVLVIVVGWSTWTPATGPRSFGQRRPRQVRHGRRAAWRGDGVLRLHRLRGGVGGGAGIEEPARDVPIGMMLSLVICTVLYIAMAAVMTGLVPFQLLGTDEPVVTAVARIRSWAGCAGWSRSARWSACPRWCW
jgi:amino acid transporter